MSALFYVVTIVALTIFIIKNTKTYWINPAIDDDVPAWVNSQSEDSTYLIDELLRQAVAEAVKESGLYEPERPWKTGQLERNLVHIAIAYGDGRVRKTKTDLY